MTLHTKHSLVLLRLFPTHTAFVKSHDSTIQDFYVLCQEAINDEYCALFEEHQFHGFVDALLASIEYQSFINLMIGKAKQSLDEHRDAHDRKAGK